MSRRLYAICEQCNRSIEAIDVHKTSADRIATLIRDADRSGWAIKLAAEDLPVGCDCTHNGEDDTMTRTVTRGPIRLGTRRLTIRQLLYVITVVAILLAIFRHPIQLMFDQRVWQAIVAPWSLYAWLFWGGEVIRLPNLKSSPMVAIAFTISAPAAVLAGFYGLWGLARGIRTLWRRVSRDA